MEFMSLRLKYSYTFFLFLISLELMAQLQDDSTRQKYGYQSIRYTTQSDMFLNQSYTRSLDSTLFSFQRYQSNFKNGLIYQDLGNWATPIAVPIAQHWNTLGLTNGFHSLDPYVYSADKMRYYSTRSPYTEIQYYQGSRGQQSMEVNFARNINPQWNIGFDLRRVVSKKIIGRVNRNDRLAEYWTAAVQFSHLSKDTRRMVLGSFNHFYYTLNETGGIKPDSGDVLDDLYDQYLERVWLSKVRTLDRRYQYRLYAQQALIGKEAVQLFLSLDHTRQTNRFDDLNISTNSIFYDTTFQWSIPSTQNLISDRTDFYTSEIKGGVKGSTNRFFYTLYGRNRWLDRKTQIFDSTTYSKSFVETYVGSQLSYTVKDSFIVGAQMDIGNEGMFKAALKAQGKGWYISGMHASQRPTSLMSRASSGLVEWTNELENPVLSQVQLGGDCKLNWMQVKPFVSYAQYNHFIYYGSNGVATQAQQKIEHWKTGIEVHFTFIKKIHVHHSTTYQHSSEKTILRVPSWTNATQFYWESWLFKKATLVQFGVDIWQRSAFTAYTYNPVFQQYYTGSQSISNPLPILWYTDVFMNIQIRKTRVFVKLSNALQGVLDGGYMSSPYYSGLPRSFDFGISWKFFD